MDRYDEKFGSRRTTVNKPAVMPAASELLELDDDAMQRTTEERDEYAATAEARAARDLNRLVAIVELDALTPRKLAPLVDVRGAAGVVIVFDARKAASMTPQQLAPWLLLEQFLQSRDFETPVYFAPRDGGTDALGAVYSQIEDATQSATSSDVYQFVTTGAAEGVPVPTVSLQNFQGWLHSSADAASTVGIVAHYDAGGAAPGLAHGMDASGSAAVAVVELARIFSQLYSDFRAQGDFNLIFILTGAGTLNYAGTARWLDTVDSRVLETLDFALCLKALGSSSALHLHSSKKGTHPAIAKVLGAFQSVAERTDGVSVALTHRRINISDPRIYWQHEMFSRKRVVSMTLSALAAPSASPGGSIFDGPERVDRVVLTRNIRFIAEALSAFIYSSSSDNDANAASATAVLGGSVDVNAHAVDAWLALLAAEPRAPFAMTKKSTVSQWLKRAFTQHTTDVKHSTFALDKALGYKFYAQGKAANTEHALTMHVYRVKHFTFDIFLALAIVLYLACIHLYFKAPATLSGWAAMFSSGSSSSKK
jgi:hypothetical protein